MTEERGVYVAVVKWCTCVCCGGRFAADDETDLGRPVCRSCQVLEDLVTQEIADEFEVTSVQCNH